MIPVGTTYRDECTFSGEATGISAALYVNGVLSAVTVTLGTARVIAGQTIQPVSVPTTGRAHGDDLEIRVSGTVGEATETHSAYVTVSAIPTNPLLANDPRLPATGVIATKTDVPSPAGDGDIAVNHSLGHDQGTDGLRLLDANDVPVDNATVEAFLATDTTYAARKGIAYTGVDGRWIAPMMLNAGTYVFRFRKDQLVVVTDAVEVA